MQDCKRRSFQVWGWQLSLLVLFGCATQPRPVELTTEWQLPDIVAETSGLVCLAKQQFLTINDSGHGAFIHHFNSNTLQLKSYPLAIEVQDTEALLLDHHQLWLADFGNNRGHRQQLKLYQFQWPLSEKTNQPSRTIVYHYPQQPALPVAPYQHDVDAEALVINEGQLFIFTKNWQSGGTDVYQIDPNRAQQRAKWITRVAPLPGVVTDAVYASAAQVYLLSGYADFRKGAIPLLLSDNFQPFIAILDWQFQLLHLHELGSGGQVEGLCVDQQQQVWLSQEQSKRRPAKLWRLGALADLLKQKDSD